MPGQIRHAAEVWAAGASVALDMAERIPAPLLLAAGAGAGEEDLEAARLRAQLQRLKGQVVATAAAAEEEQERLQKVPRTAEDSISPALPPKTLRRIGRDECAERYDAG